MSTEAAVPSRSGSLGATARRMIGASPFMRTIVKSETCQRIIQSIRAAPHLRRSGRFILRSLVGPGRASSYIVRGTATHVVLRHRTDDILVFNEVFHRRAYAIPPEVADCLRNAGRSLHVVDLGANIGMFSAWVLGCMSVGEIDAYEPDAQNLEVLRRMVIVNNIEDRVHIHATCAGVSSGIVRFTAGDFIHSRVVLSNEVDAVDVPQEDVMPLLERADLIKMDIEGSEWPILTDERWSRIAALAVAMEWHATSAVPDGEAQASAAIARAGMHVVQRYSEEPSCGILWAVRSVKE